MNVLELQNVGLRYGDRRALTDVSASFVGGEIVALAGPNGAGKSSLLHLLAGLLRPDAGRLDLDGTPVVDIDPASRAKKLAFLPADGRSSWPMNVRRIVALGRVPHLKPLRALSADDQAAIDRALERAQVTHLSERAFSTLSSGERARVLIARALATQADILLLDEPTAALDPEHQLGVMEILRAEAARGSLVIVAAHALDLVARYADRVILLRGGQVFADAATHEALSEAWIREVFGVIAPGGVEATKLELPPISAD
jgi:iron complex transport system ATP-binding protein